MAFKLKLAIIVERKAALRKEISGTLEELNVSRVLRYAEPQYARRMIETWNEPGLLVVGNAQDMDSCIRMIELCRARMAHWTVLVLDHIGSEESVSSAFTAGADDVLHVPFTSAEFIARLKIRFAQATGTEEKNKQPALSVFDDILLTHTEHKILNYLVMHKGKTVTRHELAQHVDDTDWVYGDRKYDVHINNIRNKLKKKLDKRYVVKSVRSVGYYFQEAKRDP